PPQKPPEERPDVDPPPKKLPRLLLLRLLELLLLALRPLAPLQLLLGKCQPLRAAVPNARQTIRPVIKYAWKTEFMAILQRDSAWSA
ncbi:MAG: hypothetical protein ACKOAH_13395, partial [Pirellula sp.]